MLLNCLVIDDEPIAREGLREYIENIDFLQVVQTCETALEALSILDRQTIDLLFLDIQMPRITGLEFLRSLTDPPLVILTTAYPSFALEGFELNVLDYLVKPITFQRFLAAAQKAKKQMTLLKSSSPPLREDAPDHFFIKCEQKYERIKYADLSLIESMQNYSILYTASGKLTTLMPLKNLAANLPAKDFLQVHKSFIVHLDHIKSLEGNILQVAERKVPVSRANRDRVMQLVNQRLIRR